MIEGESRMQVVVGKIFWKLLMVLSLIFVAVSGLASETGAPEDKIAVVNGSVITREQFDREMGIVRERFAQRGKPLGDIQLLAIQNQVLESLISRELLYQESQKKGIKVEQGSITEQFNKLKERFPSEEEFRNTLKRMNVSEDLLKSQIERGLLIQEFVDKEFGQKVTIPDKDVKAYYDSHPDSFKRPEQVRASHILRKVDPIATEPQKGEARKKIEEVQRKVKKGEDFAGLAREFSEGPSSVNGGDLGFFGRGQMVKPFEDAAFALKPGEVSDIVETQFGYHLIKVTDRQPETVVAYADVKDRLQEYLKEQKVQEELGNYIEKVKGEAKIERLL